MPPKFPGECGLERRGIPETVLDGNTTLPREASVTELVTGLLFDCMKAQLLLSFEETQKNGVNNQRDLSLYLNSRRLGLSKNYLLLMYLFLETI